MSKTNSTFKLSKSAKRVISATMDKEQRNITKRLLVEAENAFIVNKNKRGKISDQEEK